MARLDYSGLRATASRLIDRFGQDCILRRTAVTGPDFAQTRTVRDHPIVAVDLHRNVTDAGGSRQAPDDASLVTRSVRTLFVAAGDVVPTRSDEVVIGGEVTQIDAVRPLTPGGTAVLFEVDLAA